MCDGTYQYPFKGGAAKSVAAIIVICGNKHPAELYPNAWQYIEARFKVVNLGEPKSVIINTTRSVVIQNYRDKTRVSIAAVYETLVYAQEYHCEYQEPDTLDLVSLPDDTMSLNLEDYDMSDLY